MESESKDPMYYHPFHAYEYVKSQSASSPESGNAGLPPLSPTRTHGARIPDEPSCAISPQTPYTVSSLAALESAFVCPISHELMKDPVVDSEGNSYERVAILQWLQRGNAVSPLTRSPLHPGELRPNRALKAAIVHFQQLQRATRQRPSVGGRRYDSS